MAWLKPSNEELEKRFFPVQMDEDQKQRSNAVNQAAFEFAKIVRDNAPSCPDLTASLRHIEDAAMNANKAIAKGEL